MLRVAMVVATVLVLLVAGALTAAWALQRNLIYFPSTGPVPPAATVIPGARDVVLETDDGLNLHAWFIPARDPDRGMAVLVAHGNGGDRSSRAPLARDLSRMGFAVLLFDYRGYGANPGSPSEQGLARDVRAARQFLIGEIGVPQDRLLYFGESLGAAVVTELATEHPPAGLVLRSPFVDLASVGELHYPLLPVRALLRDQYALVEHLAEVSVPVTVVYGDSDSIVPPEQSRAVALAAPNLYYAVAVPGADHNDRALLDGDALLTAVDDLADHVSQER